MKKTILLLAVAALLASCGNKSEAQKLESARDTISWAVGRSMAESIRATGIDVDKATVLRAVEATLNNGTQLLGDSAYRDAMNAITTFISMNQRQQMQQQSQAVQERQLAYFKQLEQNPNVKKTASNIYYEVVKPGEGKRCAEGDVVQFHYRSFFAYDHKLYDQTYGNREPITHVLGAPMFPALIEAFTLMPAGATYRFYFPTQALSGVDPAIGDNPMIYEIELFAINPTNTVK
ncbi:MAG: FKBP-type peptidyl-prolyl cis-trans isomerase [Bacteroidales bacterium]|nr:FKBP-type peptidyl-prolyl cis-trans isomerase [Bacteroidales bacterium]